MDSGGFCWLIPAIPGSVWVDRPYLAFQPRGMACQSGADGIGGLCGAADFGVKQVIRRERPAGEWGGIYRAIDPHSFPSGHATRAALLAALAAGWGRSGSPCCWRPGRLWSRWRAWQPASTISRMLAGAVIDSVWPSDALAASCSATRCRRCSTGLCPGFGESRRQLDQQGFRIADPGLRLFRFDALLTQVPAVNPLGFLLHLRTRLSEKFRFAFH